jgi:hypothetical protein
MEEVAYPKPLGEDGGGDLLELGHLNEHLVVGGLVEQNGVVHLLLLLSLAPLLQRQTASTVRSHRHSFKRIINKRPTGIRQFHLLLLLAAPGLGRLRRRRRGLLRGLQGTTRHARERISMGLASAGTMAREGDGTHHLRGGGR